MTIATFQIVLLLLLGAICVTLVCIAWMIQRMFLPTAKQRVKILRDRTEFNIQLVEDEAKRRLLTRFAYSEAGIGTHLAELADKKEGEMDQEAKEIAKDTSRWGKFKAWLKENSETLVGKVNDIAKSALGLGGK